MPVLTLEEAPVIEFETIPEDTVIPARISKVEVKTMPFTDDEGNPVRKVEFSFVLLPDQYDYEKDGEMRKKTLWGQTSTNFSTSEYSKLRNWATEIMGVDELPAGFALDTDSLVGSEVNVIVQERQWEDKKAGLKADGTYPIKKGNRVKDIRRIVEDDNSGWVEPGAEDEPF